MNDFIWCDLSTFDVPRAVDFYRHIFGWTTHRDGDYVIAESVGRPAAGLYVMPNVYRQMGLPSFWMSYVRVADLDAKVRTAVDLGAIEEVAPTRYDKDSRYALVRDPSGAGFTLYEGPDLAGRHPEGRAGCMAWNELHVADSSEVAPFYEGVLGWRFNADPAVPGRYLLDAGGTTAASVQEIDPAIKGRYNYWIVYFYVPDLAKTIDRVRDSGGEVNYSDGQTALVFDDQGAALCITDQRLDH